MLTFEHKKDVLGSLDAGQKSLIIKWLDEMHVKGYTLNDDLTIDITSSVYINCNGLIKFPNYIQFNEVYFNFSCSSNVLTSLRGCPEIVKGSFSCHDNKLSSLKYSPKYVGCYYRCGNNPKKFTENYIRNKCKIDGNVYNHKIYSYLNIEETLEKPLSKLFYIDHTYINIKSFSLYDNPTNI